MINIIRENKNKNNSNGVYSIGEHCFFYKFLWIEDFRKEIKGYNLLRKYYPVPELLLARTKNNHGLIIFRYEDSIQKDKGLLVDYFAQNDELNIDYYNIIDLFYGVFLKTFKKSVSSSSDVFFKNRISTRINKYYSTTYLKKFSRKQIILNGKPVEINLTEIIESIIEFFETKRKTWNVISQCDPNDMNIGTKPMIFDFLAGGRNPLMAEFATFFWYNIGQANYLALKYNQKAFTDHKDIYQKMDKVHQTGDCLNHKFSRVRKEAIRLYISSIIIPILRETEDFENWYLEFKNYLAMKILAVWDVTKMTQEDQLFSLSYLAYFYSLDLNKPTDLIKILEGL